MIPPALVALPASVRRGVGCDTVDLDGVPCSARAKTDVSDGNFGTTRADSPASTWRVPLPLVGVPSLSLPSLPSVRKTPFRAML